MTSPQPALLHDPGTASSALVLDLAGDPGRVLAHSAGAAGLAAELEAAHGPAELGVTVAYGHQFLERAALDRPPSLTPFEAIAASNVAPATGGDVLLHVQSNRPDLNLELLRRMRALLGDSVLVNEEIHGFRYLDSRDLTGFIDGTENPAPDERAATALIADGPCAGGSFVITQRYIHELAAWEQLADSEQEAIIGRSKPDSIELPDETRPDTAHISRVVMEEDGEELEIWRKSFPYGTTSEAGLFFIAFSARLDIFKRMLARMYGVDDDLHDRLMDFTNAVSGAYFYAPSADQLAAVRA